MEETILEEYYQNKGTTPETFTETLAIVKYKIENKIPMTTAKEELVEDFINEWAEIFGYNTI
jgi:hypothetical protein